MYMYGRFRLWLVEAKIQNNPRLTDFNYHTSGMSQAPPANALAAMAASPSLSKRTLALEAVASSGKNAPTCCWDVGMIDSVRKV